MRNRNDEFFRLPLPETALGDCGALVANPGGIRSLSGHAGFIEVVREQMFRRENNLSSVGVDRHSLTDVELLGRTRNHFPFPQFESIDNSPKMEGEVEPATHLQVIVLLRREIQTLEILSLIKEQTFDVGAHEILTINRAAAFGP